MEILLYFYATTLVCAKLLEMGQHLQMELVYQLKITRMNCRSSISCLSSRPYTVAYHIVGPKISTQCR